VAVKPGGSSFRPTAGIAVRARQPRAPRWQTRAEGKPIKGTPAKFIDYTLAPDAETAEKQVAEAHDIRKDLRDRLVAIRED
jgi:hypothetical protein